jgi:hypothetical protein
LRTRQRVRGEAPRSRPRPERRRSIVISMATRVGGKIQTQNHASTLIQTANRRSEVTVTSRTL